MRINGTDKAESWEAIYQAGDAGWDIKKPAPPFNSLMKTKPTWLKTGAMAIPGCGNGHDADFFAKKGFPVTAIDFAPSAIASVKEYAKSNPLLETFEGDFLALPDQFSNSFDYVLEHTCYCAIPQENRPSYVKAVKQILKKDGILFGLFYRFDEADDKGPPHTTSEEEIRTLFEQDFEILELSTPTNSHGKRQNRERFIAMKVKK
jgi:methyl halide transferase